MLRTPLQKGAGSPRHSAPWRKPSCGEVPGSCPTMPFTGAVFSQAGVSFRKLGILSITLLPSWASPGEGGPGLHRPGAVWAAVVLAGAGYSLPMGRLRGVLPLSAQRSRALFPPGRRGRSRAAGWRGRTPEFAGCGTRRGWAAPASGPRLWVAPWDAETPCCALGRVEPGLGSGCPRRERRIRAGGNARPGSEMAEWGERPILCGSCDPVADSAEPSSGFGQRLQTMVFGIL